MMELHAGHRERMKNRFLKNGLEGFDDVNVFELLLFFVLPRQDTNPLAHALLNRFGSFKDVMEATVTELQSVKGIGQNTALLIRLVAEIGKRYQISKREVKECLDSPAKVFEYVLPLFSFESMERLYLICLDTENRVLHCSEIAQGDVDSVYGNPRKIIRIATERHASKIILAHNHPSGILIPSIDDTIFTQRLLDALMVFHIQLSDHVIVGDGECLSMREHGCISR